MKSTNSRLIRADRQKVWDIITDMEGWPDWAPNAHNRVVYHRITEKHDNVVICDEIEQTAGFFKTRHLDKYTLYPFDKIEEIIIDGDLVGGFEMTLSNHPNGTLITVKTDISSKKFWLKVIEFFIGKRLLSNFWEDLLCQIANKAENG